MNQHRPGDCRHCPFYKPSPIARLRHIFQNRKKNCMGNCPYVGNAMAKAGKPTDVAEELRKLHDLSGADYVRQLKRIAGMKIFKKVEKGILSAISESNPDYDNLILGARKAVRYGYKVLLLPNPGGTPSADAIFIRKNIYKMYDIKTIIGSGSVGSRLAESVGQTRKVYLNMATTYPANKLAMEIKEYFEYNDKALEVVVAIGKKMISVERNFVMKRTFFKEFRKAAEK